MSMMIVVSSRELACNLSYFSSYVSRIVQLELTLCRD
jgi:hypothetical protein